MSDAIISGLFALTVAVFGGFVGFQTHKLLRREKLKEMIYAERLVLYKDLSRLSAELILRRVEENASLEYIAEKAAETLAIVIKNRYILPDKIFSKALHDYDPSDGSAMARYAADILKLIREDLHIETITSDMNEAMAKKSALFKGINLGGSRKGKA